MASNANGYPKQRNTASGGASDKPKVNWERDREAQAKLRRLWTQTDPPLSMAEIGREFGVTKNAICGAATRLNLPKRSEGGGFAFAVNEQNDQIIRDMRARGETWIKIGLHFGVSQSPVLARGKELGLVGLPDKRPPPGSAISPGLMERWQEGSAPLTPFHRITMAALDAARRIGAD